MVIGFRSPSTVISLSNVLCDSKDTFPKSTEGPEAENETGV